MESTVHRMCAEVIVEKNCQRVYPPGKKAPVQMEIRLVVKVLVNPTRPGFYPSKIEIGDIGGMGSDTVISKSLETLVSVDKKWISTGTIIIVFKKKISMTNVTNVSWTMGSNDLTQIEETKIVLKGGDSKNLEVLQDLINQLKKGTFKADQYRRTINFKEKKMVEENLKKNPMLQASNNLLIAQEKQIQNLEELKKLGGVITNQDNLTRRSAPLAKKPLRFRSISAEDSLSDDGGKVLPNTTFERCALPKNTSRKLETLLSRMFLPTVLKYLVKEDIKNLLMINKKTYNFLCGMNKRLDFKKYQEVPEKYFLASLNKSPNIEKLITGRMNKFKPTIDKYSKIRLNSLKSLDCSDMSNFTDSMIGLITEIAPNVTDLAVPFFSLTSHNLSLLSNTYGCLHSFKALYSGRGLGVSGVANMKLSTKMISDILCKQTSLRSFEMYSLEPIVLDSLVKKSADVQKFPDIMSFKIHHLLLASKEHLMKLEGLIIFKNLKVLHLEDLHLFDPSTITGNVSEPPCPPTDIISEVFSRLFPCLKNLTSLKIGNFFEDDHVPLLKSLAPKLTSLAIRSPHFSDEGLAQTLKLLLNLRSLSVVGCEMIHGHGFEDSPHQTLKEICVSLDEFSLNNLKKLVELRYSKTCLVANYVTT